MLDFGRRMRFACWLLPFFALSTFAIDPADQLQFADGLFARGLYDLAVREYRVLVDATNAVQADAASYRIGEARRLQGQPDTARAAYEETERRFPYSPYALRARFRLAEDAINSGRLKEGLDSLQELSVHKDLPTDLKASTLYYLGYTARRLKQDKKAEEAYKQLLEAAPDTSYAYLSRVDLASLRIAAGAKPAEINKLLEDAAKQKDVPRAAIEALLLLGDYSYRAKDFAESAEAYARLLERFPDDPAIASARLSAAWAFLKANRRDEALQQIQHAPAGNEASWLYLEANAKRLIGRTDEARAAYESLLNVFSSAPESGPAAYELALLLFQQRDFANAYARARQAPLTDELRGDLLWLRAETARETGHADEAVQLYDEVAAAKVDIERATAARFQAARLRQEAGAWADASTRYRALVDAAPKQQLAADALFASAFCRLQLKDNEEALSDWTRLIETYPGYSALDQVWFGRAQAELALERTKEAAASFESLLKGYSNSSLAPEAHLLYGSLLERQENFAAAEFHFAQALRKNSDPALARRIQFRQLAVLQRQGRSDEAAETLNQLVAGGASADIPVQLLDWAARWNLDRSNYTASVAAANALAAQQVSPGWTQIGWYLAGRAQLGMGRPDDAGASFKKAAQTGATTAEGLESAWRWGEWAVENRNWADAQQAFEQAAEQAASPDAAEIRAKSYFGLGRVAEGQERWADAARQYLAVAVLYDDPKLTPDALDAAARMFEKAGDANAAAQARRELGERYPDDPRAKLSGSST